MNVISFLWNVCITLMLLAACALTICVIVAIVLGAINMFKEMREEDKID